jgi:hypothetical protein
MAKKVDCYRSVRAMRMAVKAFDSLPHEEDRWFVLSILIRKHTSALNTALQMTPEVRVAESPCQK